ncbi:hypothetical protein HRbin25_00973 [bacterium HR25]|nr:hypothetical protein HRbin25_00973 [bacterium HR25]
MVIDFHTHIFPPEVAREREEWLRRDRLFAALYGHRRAAIATAEELLASMEAAGVEASVALGFAWEEQELCRRHNDYLLEAAARSGGRIVPFCTVNLARSGAQEEVERCVAGGARGLGELRPDDQGWDPVGPAGELLASLARRYRLPLLFHVSEPVGHRYPGKEGMALAAFYAFAEAHADLALVAAHLGGGLPFYWPMPEVRQLCQRLYFDTAAAPFLYAPDAYRLAADVAGPERLLLGSDFPLIGQGRQLEELRRAGLPEEWLSMALGENARRLLCCEDAGRG